MPYIIKIRQEVYYAGLLQILQTEDYAANIDLFVPAWAGDWTPPPFLLNWNEKWEVFQNPQGRLMSCAHRGDNNLIYPENSLEGIISVIKAGADIIEVDVHTTKDNELIIMHDDTVTRTTNWGQLKQTADIRYYPETNSICDWTYEQLRQLRLLGKDGKVTDYKIPALREVIQVAKNHVFVTLDKWNNFNWDTGVYPLLKEFQAWQTVLIPYGYSIDRAYQIQQVMRKETGFCAPFFADSVDDGVTNPQKMIRAMESLTKYEMTRALRSGEYVPEDVASLESVMSGVRGRYRIYAETLRKEHDNECHWRQMNQLGNGIIMGNSIYNLIQFIAKCYA